MTHSQSMCARQCVALLTATVLFMGMQGQAIAGSRDRQEMAKPAGPNSAHDQLYLCTGAGAPQRQLILQVNTAARRMQAHATRIDSQLPRGVSSGAIELNDRNWPNASNASKERKQLLIDSQRYFCETTHDD